MFLKIKFCKYFILLAILSLILTSCLHKNESKMKAVKLNEVTRSVFYAPQYVALGLGFFEENGLEIKLNSAEGSDKTMTAILSRQADIGLLGTSAVLSVKSQGKENCPVLFSQLTQRDGSFLVGRNENFKWDDLKGKSVIAGRKGGVPEMVFEHILKEKGIFDEVTLLNNIKFDLMGIAFSRGVGDYVCLFEPTAQVLKNEKSLFILESLGASCEKISYTGYCCSPEYMQENPEVIKSFANAIFKAEKWVKTHSAEEIADVILPYFISCSKEVLVNSLENYLSCDVWCEEPAFQENEFELLEKIMMQAGELEEKVAFKDVVENKFALCAEG